MWPSGGRQGCIACGTEHNSNESSRLNAVGGTPRLLRLAVRRSWEILVCLARVLLASEESPQQYQQIEAAINDRVKCIADVAGSRRARGIDAHAFSSQPPHQTFGTDSSVTVMSKASAARYQRFPRTEGILKASIRPLLHEAYAGVESAQARGGQGHPQAPAHFAEEGTAFFVRAFADVVVRAANAVTATGKQSPLLPVLVAARFCFVEADW